MQQDEIIGFPLSYQQRRLWNLFHTNPSHPRNTQLSVAIEGQINPDAFQDALTRIVDRHQVLRTAFHHVPGLRTPIQVVSDTGQAEWQQIDLREYPRQQQEVEIDQIFDDFGKRVYDVGNIPLIGFICISLTDRQHVLLISGSSLVADIRSLMNLTVEIGRIYTGSIGHSTTIDAPVQYVEYSEWHNILLAGKAQMIEEAPWRCSDLSVAFNPRLPLVTASDSGERHFRPEHLHVPVSRGMPAALDTLALQLGTSSSLLLLTCWQVFLSRLTGQSNITVATAFDGRSYSELQESLGLFQKHIPISCQLERGVGFNQLAERISRAAEHTAIWQDHFSWDDINKAHNTNSTSHFLPFCFDFDELLTVHSGVAIYEGQRKSSSIEPFLFKLSGTCRAGTLEIELHYDAESVTGSEAARLARQFGVLMGSILSNPLEPVDRQRVMTNLDRDQLIFELAGAKNDVHGSQCMHELFEDAVRNYPDNIAVRFENQQLTYAELDGLSNRLAACLNEIGVRPEVLVGICLERSIQMVVSILGVLKAGGAFVMLDPTLPMKRLALMVREAQVSTVVTEESLLSRLPISDLNVSVLDVRQNRAPREAESPDGPKAVSENLAYAVFTSGSTGIPKAVGIEHRQLVNYVRGIIERLNLSSGVSYALVTSLAADLGYTSVFPALFTGGTVHIVAAERAWDPEAFAEYVQGYSIECLKIAPSHLFGLLSGKDPTRCLPRQMLIVGGEPFSWELSDLLRSVGGSCVIVNHYGPTETTIGALVGPVEDESNHRQSLTVPVGRPLQNVQAYVLDKELQPVPFWAPGELYIGGAGLSRGYLGKPGMTAASFIPHPFSREPGERLYRTGDLARWLSDGRIELLGRDDRQVKLRGFRVELAEIEAVLKRHRAIRDSVVVARGETEGNKQLIAYVTCGAPQYADNEQLRTFMQDRLPDHMVPSSFVTLPAIPLTHSGKVDYKALPLVDRDVAPDERGYVAPRSTLEEVLAELWAEVLRRERIGIYDDFFMLGGHSLLATQLVSRLRAALQVDLPIRIIFEAPTIASMSESLTQHEAVPGHLGKVAHLYQRISRMSADELRRYRELTQETNNTRAFPGAPGCDG